MKTISHKTIERYCKKIERQNLKKTGTSLSWVSLLNRIPILCVHNGCDLVDVPKNWKDSINKFCCDVKN